MFTPSAGAADPPVFNIVFRADFTLFGYLNNGTVVGTRSGAPTVIAAGTYKVILDDSSGADMEFELAGPGVKLNTNMSHTETSSAAYYETFQVNSTYTFRDDNHPSVVWTFQTSSDVISSSPTTTIACPTCSKPDPTASGSIVGSARSRGTLAATVGASGKIAVAFKGKPVARLKAGRYTVVVVDRSSQRGFTVQRLNGKAQALTSAALVGKRSRTLTLTAGRWMFFSPGGPKSSFYVVT